MNNEPAAMLSESMWVLPGADTSALSLSTCDSHSDNHSVSPIASALQPTPHMSLSTTHCQPTSAPAYTATTQSTATSQPSQPTQSSPDVKSPAMPSNIYDTDSDNDNNDYDSENEQ